MPDDDRMDPSPELPELSELEDRPSESPPIVVESEEIVAPEDLPAAQSNAAAEGPALDAAVAATASSGSDNPVLRAYETDVHETIVELRRIESDIRDMLADRDPVRKRKFSGTARWHELEDDLIRWRFTGRFDEDMLRRVQELIGRRHYLFRHLRYLSSTRPVWNS